MKIISVICPTCSRTLTVSENAPSKLMCPRCLGAVDNPAGLLTQQAQSEQAHGRQVQRAPRPVIPIARQAHSDMKAATAAVVVLIPLLVFGTAAALVFADVRQNPFWLVPAVLLLGLIVYILMIAQRGHSARRSTAVLTRGPRFDTGKLEYAAADPRRPVFHPALQFTCGFIAVVVVALLAIFVLRPSPNSLFEISLLILIPGLVSLGFRGYRAIGLGILVALGLCIVLPIGICFAAIAIH